LNDPAVGKSHSGMVVVVNRRRIWAAGKDHGAAWAAASRKPGYPPRATVAFVVIPDRMGGKDPR
jgi:hypothetical protein